MARNIFNLTTLLAACFLLACNNQLFHKSDTPPEGEPQPVFHPLPTLPMHIDSNYVRLFLCGDVMTGRGIDQALPFPGNPHIPESFIKDARDYLRLAELQNGRIPVPVSFDYIWGDALPELEKHNPDVRIINLETSITSNDVYWPEKAVNYRMHPKNAPCLSAAGIDGCTLANNHVLDWDYDGLAETLHTLAEQGIKTAGAGLNENASLRPAIWELKNGRVVLFSYGSLYSGVPPEWEAIDSTPGINFLKDFSERTIQEIKAQIEALKRPNDVVVFSIHWGSNWGYKISNSYRQFAHRLIDEAGVDLIHGHSSHHFKGIEIYKEKLIIYGAGDFINDYEGISGNEQYRGDLTIMYFPVIDPIDGRLIELELVPLVIRRFKLNKVNNKDARWVKEVLDREGKTLGTYVEWGEGKALNVRWLTSSNN